MMVEFEHVSAEYPGGNGARHQFALNDVSFSVEKGERVALIGANGAGKSTLLLAMLGLVPLHEGKITVDGVVLSRKTEEQIRRKAGLLFQNPDDQLFMSTVWEDVLFGPLNSLAQGRRAAGKRSDRKGGRSSPPLAGGAGGGVQEIEQTALTVLRELGIEGLKDKMPHKLSGGEKRLAALAGVLVMKSEILLADEPTAFLDPRATRRLTAIFSSLPQTFLIATHDYALARALCPRTVLLAKGRLAADAPTEQILGDAALLEQSGL
jgi:cobalt/nickel transport system ATP-binding protein